MTVQPVADPCPITAGPGAVVSTRRARYFNGTTHYGNRAGDATSRTTLQGNWTMEAWVKMAGAGRRYIFAYGGGNDTQVQNHQGAVSVEGSGHLRTLHEAGAGVDEIALQSTGTTVPNDVWTHVAVVKNGLNFRFFVGGVFQEQVAVANQPDGGTDAAVQWYIGQSASGTSFFSGYMRSLRISNVARADVDVAASAARANFDHANDGSTFLLLELNEAPDALDESTTAMHLRRSVGSGPITSEGLAEDGGLSRVFDGTFELQGIHGNATVHPATAAIRTALLGSCTVEAWIRPHQGFELVGARGWFLFGDPGPEDEPNNFIGVELESDMEIRAYMEHGAGLDSIFSVASGLGVGARFRRMHVALVKTVTGADAVIKLYVNGVLKGTSGTLTNFTGSTLGYLRIGAGPLEADEWIGELDDIRISNVARSDADILDSYRRGSARPVIENLTPASGSTLATDRTPIEFDLVDKFPGFRTIEIWIKFANQPRPWVVYDGLVPSFYDPVERGSTITAITDGYHIKLVPNGTWPDSSFDLIVRAIDQTGNVEGV